MMLFTHVNCPELLLTACTVMLCETFTCVDPVIVFSSFYLCLLHVRLSWSFTALVSICG